MTSTLLVAFLAIFGVLLLHRFTRRSLDRRRLPPGPKGLPLIGNLWDVPAEYPWLTYARWADTYGDILYLDTPGNPTVVLNSTQVRDGPLRKTRHRRMVHQYFQPRAVPTYYPAQMRATLVLLQQLHKSPDEFVRHVRHHAGSVIMKTVYGYDVDPNGDRFVEIVDRALESIRIIGNMGTFLVDSIPSLKYLPRWFPGANFANGLAASSLVSVNLAKMNDISVSERMTHLEVTRNTAAVAFSAGADTTVSVVLSTILAFLLYPEVQAKAQAELDAVVGPNRLPNFDDRPQLPYIEAILLEALRWNPVVPMSFDVGIAHRNVQEDVYRGYYIPAGTTIIGNTWWISKAILHDEKDYPNPLVFDPERFMSAEGKECQPEPIAAFGFGRRICPGRYLASNTAWIAIASMASTLSFTKAVDPEAFPYLSNARSRRALLERKR
ncbi:cytochrome P450 [Armillaria borealis]|uniref:Cytochrome P450 n=1 Tax=Armillaria borealis TaxID=47425 RepID=A0AA39JP24_9AGAR|nr:cytochrome P450 [Armillaria borealis]